MLKEERHNRILEILNIDKKVYSRELSTLLKVSEDTIRRDLIELNQKKKLKRVRKGAILLSPPQTDFENRQLISPSIKTSLGKFTQRILEENTTIIIDTGTTNLQLVRQLPVNFKCTIITNSPPIAMALSKHQNITVISLGGILNQESMVNYGAKTYEELGNIQADLYVMGVHHIDLELGLSVPTYEEAQIKKRMTEVSAKSIGMCTSDKLETVSNYISNPVEDLSVIVTYNAKHDIIKRYKEKGVVMYNLPDTDKGSLSTYVDENI